MNLTTPRGAATATNDDAAAAALDKTASSLHDAVDKMAEAADDAARTVTPAIDRAAQLAHQTVDKAAGAAAPAVAWLDQQGNSLRERRQTMTTDTERYVCAHPWKAIGVALAAGFFIGRVLR